MLNHVYVLDSYFNSVKIHSIRSLRKNELDKIFFVIRRYVNNLYWTNKNGSAYNLVYSQVGIRTQCEKELYIYLYELSKYSNLMYNLELCSFQKATDYFIFDSDYCIIKKKEIDFDFTMLVFVFILDSLSNLLSEMNLKNFFISTNSFIIASSERLFISHPAVFSDNSKFYLHRSVKYKFLTKLLIPRAEKEIKGTFGTSTKVELPEKFYIISFSNIFLLKVFELFTKKNNVTDLNQIPDSLSAFMNIEHLSN